MRNVDGIIFVVDVFNVVREEIKVVVVSGWFVEVFFGVFLVLSGIIKFFLVVEGCGWILNLGIIVECSIVV